MEALYFLLISSYLVLEGGGLANWVDVPAIPDIYLGLRFCHLPAKIPPVLSNDVRGRPLQGRQ